MPRRQRRLGGLGGFANASDTLDHYVSESWAQLHGVTLAPKTAKHYDSLYDVHLGPYLGALKLSELTPEVIAGWQAERIADGAGPVAVRQALMLLGAILQRAMEGGRLARNPVRLVRKVGQPRRREVRPLAPAIVEALRDASKPRDAALISVLAYSGLRPQEALALQWGDIRERTILVERAASLGAETDTKTQAHRTVRLLAPLRDDLLQWRMRAGRPADKVLVFLVRKDVCGQRRRMTTGVGVRLTGLWRRPGSATRRPTRCGTRSLRCCCTRAARSCRWLARWATTPS